MYKPFFDKYLKNIDGHIFAIYGENDLFRYQAKKHLLSALGDFPITQLEKPTLNDIESEINTIDLFADKKIIWIENFPVLATTNAKKIEDNEVKALVESLNQSEHIIVFYQDGKVDGRKKAVKEILKSGWSIVCDNVNKKDFQKFIEYLIDINNLKVPKNLLTELSIYLSECDPFLLYKEFEKLTLYPGEITKYNIYDLLSVNHTQNIFNLVDQLCNKNIHETLSAYDNLLFNKESEYMIYHNISNQFTLMLKIKMIKEDNILIDIPTTLNIHPFRCDKLEKNSRNFTLEQLINIQNLLLDTDMKIKLGITNSVDAVRFLIMSICSIS